MISQITIIMKNIKYVKFEVLKIIDARKSGSTIEIGKIYIGEYHIKSNWIYFSDINEQEWCFYVDDTCRILDDEI